MHAFSRWPTSAGGRTDEPSKNGQLCYPDDIDWPLREAAQKNVLKYQNAVPAAGAGGWDANDHSTTFMLAIASTTGRLHAEFLRLLFWHAHREREKLLKLTGQLAQPNQDAVFSQRAGFFNSFKSKVGHIMAKASALPST